MSPDFLFPLAILSSFLWSSLDLPRKWLVAEIPAETAIFYICLFQGLGFLLLLPFFWETVPGAYWWLLVVDILVCCAFNFFLLKSFSLAPLSAVSPLLALTPVFTFILGFFSLQEPLGFEQVLGSGIILLGAFLLPERRVDEGSRFSHLHYWSCLHSFFQPSRVYMLLAALFLALAMVLDKRALTSVSFFMHGAFLSLGVSASMFLAAFWRYGRLPLPTLGQYKHLGLSTLLGMAALSTQLLALAQMSAGVFESLKRSCCALFTILLSSYFLKEQVCWRKILACCIMGIGLFVSVS